eukprot:TRINITY_DN103078_c0_g1_i1.p1 TRINITY_DN103078_c0_g1~~TRINITY_DN103078_c0_g1_i1.p1  ORF type:complete len:396 (+),score=25.09 TRINITY_DN103078_c0_g1_i1:96-1283(+)
MKRKPDAVRPLPTPALKRSRPKTPKVPARDWTTAPGMDRRVTCCWPGCECRLPERRLDSDMNPYTKGEFAQHYAPATGVTSRWDRASPEAAYCSDHMPERQVVLERLGLCETDANRFACAGWLHLHPEHDEATLSSLDDWWQESKKLYQQAHPNAMLPQDASLELAEVYCFSNKVTRYVTTTGKAEENRWTYNPANMDGNTAQNRKLLAHGCPFERLQSVIDHDLLLSGAEVASTSGHMLGEGFYVTDSLMKSLQYARPGRVDGRPTKVVLLAEVNMGKPRVASRQAPPVWEPNRGWSRSVVMEPWQDSVTREDITFARGLHHFARSKQLKSGWGEGLRLPLAVSLQTSANPFQRLHPHGMWPLLFNEWCVHNTERYSLAYLVLFQEPLAPFSIF